MNHILLESQDDAVKRFFLTLATDSQGAIVEWNGQAVACVLPPPIQINGKADAWTDAMNDRRCELIDRKYVGPALTPAEMLELAVLQEEMLRYRDRVAPLANATVDVVKRRMGLYTSG